MVHFAVACPESPGHMNPMTTLLKELQQRGHQITWVGFSDAAKQVQANGFQSRVIGQETFPLGSYDRYVAELGKKSGLAAVGFTLEIYRQAIQASLRESPAVLRDSGAEFLIADESIFCSRTLAELLEWPWVSISNALPFHPDPMLPPAGLPWSYRSGRWGRIRNSMAYGVSRFLLRSIHREIRGVRQQHGLPDYDWLEGNASHLATLVQITQEFDFPRENLPDWFHYVGGLHNQQSRAKVDFPFEQLDGRPLIYASMGTAQNRLMHVFREIARACADLPWQLVISMGGGAEPADLGELPGDPLVVPFAPQLQLIERAHLVVTHAGMNTTIETMAQGCPMVAIPVTNDQPAVAARIEDSGCGKMVPLSRVSSRLKPAITAVLEDERFRKAANRLKEANQRAGGAPRAADIIESIAERQATASASPRQVS